MYSSLNVLFGFVGGGLRKWKAGTEENSAQPSHSSILGIYSPSEYERKAVEDMLCPQFNGFTQMTADSGVSYKAYVTAPKQGFDRTG